VENLNRSFFGGVRGVFLVRVVHKFISFQFYTNPPNAILLDRKVVTDLT
jgi:hypothetical protein